MRAKVDQYQSVTFRAIRYHQGDEFEFSTMQEIEDIKDFVTVLNEPDKAKEVTQVKSHTNEEEA